jgi:polar amino acid transport system ATP-binding protein
MTSGPEPLLTLHGLCKTYANGVRALDGVNLKVPRGQVVCLIGPSGGGKSTLLRCVNLLERPTAGEIWVGDHRMGEVGTPGRSVRPASAGELARQRTRIGMVFQSFNLWPHLSAIDNVMLGLVEVKHLSEHAAARAACDALGKVGLIDKIFAFPQQLSGGQQQRVAIARALVMDPVLMLFDEPTSALDPELVHEVLGAIEQLAADGMTMLIATHEMSFARRVAHSIVFMDQGRIVESGPPQAIFDNSRHERLQKFIARV